MMMGWRAGGQGGWTALFVGLVLGGALPGCAKQPPVLIWEGRQESVQQTRQSAPNRGAEGERAARAALQDFRALLSRADAFDPDRVAQALALSITERSGRYRPTSPEFVTLRPRRPDTPITSVRIILKPETGRSLRGSQITMALSSERFGCITLADVTAVFGEGYEAERNLPFQPPWPVEVPVDVAVYRIDATPPRSVSFGFRFLDCLGSIDALELLD
ncbi:hypothetical protein ACVFYP_21920 [Roseomonas sp. F4]